MVTIGSQLKKTRILLGLTGEQMCKGVLTESAYSRVERGQSEIDIDKLIELLNNHRVSLADFFTPFDQRSLEEEVKSAFLKKDTAKLKSLAKNFKLQDKTNQIKIRLMLGIINGKIDTFSETFRRKAKSQLLQIGTVSQDFLFNLNLVMPFCDLEELEILLAYIFDQYSKYQIDNENLVILESILVSYIERTYQEKEFEKTKYALTFVDKLPKNADFALKRMIIGYYSALLDKDSAQVTRIRNFLQKNGYSTVISKLPKLIN